MSATVDAIVNPNKRQIIAQFQSHEGDQTGPQLSIPLDINVGQLQYLLNELLKNEEKLPYSFYLSDEEIANNLLETFEKQKTSTEEVLTIVYQPQSVFRVRAVTRCSATIPGHAEAILTVQFSPDGKRLASGSGDTTVRFWDISTQLPEFTCKAHSNWVLCVAWSPDAKKVVSGSLDATLQLWDPVNGKANGSPMKLHTKWITSIVWEPFHLNPKCNRFASASKDGSVRIWNSDTKRCELSLSHHTDVVTCVKWGGEGLIYTASRDRTIKVWDAKDGKLCRTLEGHGHWVNTMALNTDYALRTGPFNEEGKISEDLEEAQKFALKKYQAARGNQTEKLISGSDDFTLFLWEPEVNKKPIARLTGHQQLVNQVNFSPDGRLLASASFDKSVKLWDGKTGKFLKSLRGHVGAVYQVTWSHDSRLLLSGSKDSTLKVWDISSGKLLFDLPGHADEVYSVDWSPDGECVASGGKDKNLKLWKT